MTVELARGYTVRAGLQQGGVSIHPPPEMLALETRSLWERSEGVPVLYDTEGNTSLQDKAAAERYYYLASALARYLNSGGTWDELHTIVRSFQNLFPFSLSFAGWELIATYTDQNLPVHCFRRQNTDEVVRWHEDVAVDKMDLEQLEREWYEADEDD